VLRQRRLADPLIDLMLFRVPAFGKTLTAFLLSIFVIAGILLFIAQYLRLVLGLSPLVAGLWTLSSAGGLIVGSMLAPLLARQRTACLDRLSYDVLSERHPQRRGRSGRRSSTPSRGRVGSSGMTRMRRSRSSCRQIGWSLGRGCGSTSLCFINRTGHLLQDVEYLHHGAW
jgi:hypothetical protein